MIKTPLRYPGGKSKAIKSLAPFIPNFEEYREPFLGGGSMFIYLKQKYPQKKYWINDVYENLFYFWENCKDNPKELLNQIIVWKNEFKDGKDLYKFLTLNINNFTPIQKAAAFFVFNRITFSGTTESGGYSDSAFHNRFTDTSIERVKLLGEILDNTQITNYDFSSLLENVNESVFIFLDPPYYSATKSALYGKNGKLHKGFDHINFAQKMKNVKAKWLITYDDSDYIKELFSFAFQYPWNFTYGMKNVSSKTSNLGNELIITNYDANLQYNNSFGWTEQKLFNY